MRTSRAVSFLALLGVLGLAGCSEPDPAAAYAAGAAAYDVRDLRKAEKAFESCTELQPSNVDAWMMLARIHLELGDIKAARAAHGHAAELAGGDADVLELGGQLCYHDKDFKAARTAYEAMVADKKYGDAVRSRGYCGLAVIDMAELGRSTPAEGADRARVELMQAILLDGRNAAARYHLGRLYRDVFGYNESALDQFLLYVRLDTQSSERVKAVDRKVIPGLRDQIAQSAAQLSGADRRDSAASAAALKKAEEAWKKQSFKTAKLRYGDAFAADVLSYPAAMGLAKSWEKTDPSPAGLREALKYYTAAAKLRPSSRDTLMICGDLAVRIGNHTSAKEAYSRVVAARPTDISAIDGLIRALQRCGSPKSAAIYQKYRDGLPARTR